MSATAAISVQGLSHWYGDRQALDRIEFTVAPAEIFGLLGPNGGGKTTLFRILTTLLPLRDGTASILGFDLRTQPGRVRFCIGVTFQSPSLDAKLTVSENLVHQAHLYGLYGGNMCRRIGLQLERLGLTDRAFDRVESLSGGLKRRVEIAKGLLHDPQVVLLDEPSTGLDPGARIDLWRTLQQLRSAHGVTVVVATHLMDEAERCDRLGILDTGRLVALGSPDELRASIGGDCLKIQAKQPDDLARRIRERFGIEPVLLANALRIERPRGHEFLRELVDAFADDIVSVSLGKPTLEDVFVARTGHRFWETMED